MSLGQEWCAENEGVLEEVYRRAEKQAETKVWRTKDGRELNVSEMSERHIKNTINYIRRNDPVDVMYPWIKVFEEELKRRERSEE